MALGGKLTGGTRAPLAEQVDIGTGDGKLLLALHKECGIPWENLVGVTAEDMRGVKTRPDKEPFDLRKCPAAGEVAAASYIVWNAESLDECPALQGRKFDLVVSWMTFCWLSDPLGTLELVHDSFLVPNGLLVAGQVQMLTQQAEVIEDQRFLSSLRDKLRSEGRKVDIFSDAGQCWHSWVFLRKKAVSDSCECDLGLSHIVRDKRGRLKTHGQYI